MCDLNVASTAFARLTLSRVPCRSRRNVDIEFECHSPELSQETKHMVLVRASVVVSVIAYIFCPPAEAGQPNVLILLADDI